MQKGEISVFAAATSVTAKLSTVSEYRHGSLPAEESGGKMLF
jgi:hypothetical protein